MASYFNS